MQQQLLYALLTLLRGIQMGFDDDEEEAAAVGLHSMLAELTAAATTSVLQYELQSSPSSQRTTVNRQRLYGHFRLFHDYFADSPTYNERYFRRRFRMPKELFSRVVSAITRHDDYFVQKRDAAGRLGLSSLQKATAAMRVLAYGTAADAVDEYVRIGESTVLESLRKFCSAVVEVFGEEYLRYPTAEDVKRLLAVGETRGFRGMLGSLDCMHWTWKNCPTAWHGQYTGKEKEPTIVLEAVASYDLWIWHAFFGMPGSHNDINVLDHSPLFSDLCEGKAPQVSFVLNNNEYNKGYYLADGIYPSWSTLVQTITEPQGQKKKHFAQLQEAARKDVERAFGVLQARFGIIKGPARLWKKEELNAIMKACIILHNMVVEGDRDLDIDDIERVYGFTVAPPQSNAETKCDMASFVQQYKEVMDARLHHRLRNDIIEHLWQRKGEEDI